jgi:hypothetical protein
MKTTFITPTTGSPYLYDAMMSVKGQAKHLIVVDGRKHLPATLEIMDRVCNPDADILVLPENVGADGWYGHRVYASVPMLINTEFYAHLDEDNMVDPHFCEVMEREIEGRVVVTCRRQVVAQDGAFIGIDDHESVGANRYGYTLYDTNTYLIRSDHAHKIAPFIYGRWGADRQLSEAVFHIARHVPKYLSIYRAPEKLYDFFR